MASLTTAAISIPSFAGLRGEAVPKQQNASHGYGSSLLSKVPISASMMQNGDGESSSSQRIAMKAATSAAIAAALLLSAPAMAAKVEVGDEVGSFIFTPNNITVAPGEPIEFTLVGETGHNVVFDVSSDTPPDVAAELQASSMGENDLLTEDEPTFVVKLSKPGKYSFFCTPHKSANMQGVVNVVAK